MSRLHQNDSIGKVLYEVQNLKPYRLHPWRFRMEGDELMEPLGQFAAARARAVIVSNKIDAAKFTPLYYSILANLIARVASALIQAIVGPDQVRKLNEAEPGTT